MENKLQEVKKDFTERLFEVINYETNLNHNNDLFHYYDLIITNLDKHTDLFEDILKNGLKCIDYIDESMWYTDGCITIYLNNNTKYDIYLIYNEETIGENYEDEKQIIHHEYYINKTTLIKSISEDDTDKELLQQIQEETESKLKEFKLKYTQQKLDKLLEERTQLNLNIDELQKELNLAS